MWQQISKHISEVTNTKFQCDRRSSIGGGCINQAYCVSDSDNQYFVKVNTANRVDMFTAEAMALEQMHETKTIRVPKPICWGVADSSSYIVLEWLNLNGRRNWQQLGEKLAAMHRTVSSSFGWQQANTIGATPQINQWSQNWVEFWCNQRIGYQLQLAQRKGFRCSVPEEQLFEAMPKFFVNYQPQPSMVHGDLWGGNVEFTDSGEPVIFDPALYYGDREVDLAMTELFGGFASDFYTAYDRAFPLNAGYEERKTLYNLYHILNHFNLFGGGYSSQANRMIERVCAMVR